MMFGGYLLKKPFSEIYFPEEFVVYGSWKTTPNRRQDLNSVRDRRGVLHRGVVAGRPSTIVFSVRDGLHLADKEKIQAFWRACMQNEAQKKVFVEFWDDENNVYKQEHMYLPDIEFPILYHTKDDIIYGGIDYELIGYGN